MGLNCYLPGNMIMIDAYGWGDLLMGVVIGAIKPPQRMLLERRIPTSAFQVPNFSNKKYLDIAKKISDEIITIMKPNQETCIKIGSEYILSGIISYFKDKGLNVQRVDSTGELNHLVEEAYTRWCVESGVPRELFKHKRRFWVSLDWVAENPHIRERLVKTGWSSWESKWRNEIFNRHNSEFHSLKGSIESNQKTF